MLAQNTRAEEIKHPFTQKMCRDTIINRGVDFCLLTYLEPVINSRNKEGLFSRLLFYYYGFGVFILQKESLI
jgi:hypothetical protein